MTTLLTRLARAAGRVAAGLAAVVIIAAPIVVIALVAGNPFTHDVWTRISQRRVDDTTIVRLGSVAFYLLWAWFILPALRQTQLNLAARPTPPAPPSTSGRRNAPTVVVFGRGVVDPAALPGPRGWLARLVRHALAAGAIVAALTTTGTVRVAAGPAARPVPITAPATAAPAHNGDLQPGGTPTVERASVHVAQRRDTAYSIAARLFPDRVDAARDDIVALNHGRTAPDGTIYRGGGFPAGMTVITPEQAPTPEQPPPDQPTTDPPVTAPAAPTTVTAAPTDQAGITVTVVEGDTMWTITEARIHAIDPAATPAQIAAYWAETINANTFTSGDPNLIYPGDTIQLPALPARAAPAAAVAAPAEDGTVAVSYTVAHGDTVWDIIEHHYGHVDADTVWHIAEINHLDDPGTIWPGQVLALPDLTTTPPPADDTGTAGESPTATPTPAAPSVDTPAPAPAAPTASDGLDAPRPADAPGDPPAADPAPPVEATLPPPPTSAVPATNVAPPAPPPASLPVSASASVSPGGQLDWSAATLWWEIPMGVLLAGGLAGAVRRLRNRRGTANPAGRRVVPPDPVVAATEFAALEAANTAALDGLLAGLESLNSHIIEQTDPVPVSHVDIDDHRLEVTFTAPAPFPPAGWTSNPGGDCWTRPLDRSDDRPGDDRADPDETDIVAGQLMTPALVTIGRTAAGGEILIDLETAGVVAITGDPHAARGLARAMALEMATYALGVPMDVCLIGVDVDGVELCDRGWPATTMRRAVRVARQMLARTANAGANSLLAARAQHPDDEQFDPVVFIIDPAQLDPADLALVDEVAAACRPQAGAAAILIGEHPGADETITIGPDHTVTWRHHTLTGTVVSREAAAQVAVMFDHAANATPTPPDLDEASVEAQPSTEPILLDNAAEIDSRDGLSTVGELRWIDTQPAALPVPAGPVVPVVPPAAALTVRIFADEQHAMPDVDEVGRLLVVLVATRRGIVRTAEINDVYRNRYLRRSRSTVSDALTRVVRAGYLARPAPGQYVLAGDVWLDTDTLQAANDRAYVAHMDREPETRDHTEAAAVAELLGILNTLTGPAYTGPGFDAIGTAVGLTEGSREACATIAERHVHESIHYIQRWARQQHSPANTAVVLRTIEHVLTHSRLHDTTAELDAIIELSRQLDTSWHPWLRRLFTTHNATPELHDKLEDRLIDT